LDTRVLIISFGTLSAVQAWLKKTCTAFEVLLDREREVYKGYGLERSYGRSYSIRTLWFYIKQLLAGHSMHSSHGDDKSQLGGNIIVDQDGLVRLVYLSHDPVDRPSAEYLLGYLRKFQIHRRR
jgi:alkyl hydroperoxide reductase subunit AhpC